MISLSKILDRPIARDGRKFDVSLLWMVVLMTVFSLIMIYSASIVYAASEGDSQFSFVSKQAMFILFTVAICLPLFLLKMSFWRRIIPFYFAVSGLLLAVVLVVGREINGATRWIHIGPLNLQPTEFFKLATVLYLSSCLRAVKKCCVAWILLGWSSLFSGIGDLLSCPFKAEARVRVKERAIKFKTLLWPIVSIAISLTFNYVATGFWFVCRDCRDYYGHAVSGRLPVEIFRRAGVDGIERNGVADLGCTLPYGACGGVFEPMERSFGQGLSVDAVFDGYCTRWLVWRGFGCEPG